MVPVHVYVEGRWKKDEGCVSRLIYSVDLFKDQKSVDSCWLRNFILVKCHWFYNRLKCSYSVSLRRVRHASLVLLFICRRSVLLTCRSFAVCVKDVVISIMIDCNGFTDKHEHRLTQSTGR